jgi:dihydroflavonol-4-reductase
MTQRTALVTGISGFIAKHCAVELLKAGYRVRGTVRNLDRTAQVLDTLGKHADASAVEFAQADLMSDEGWAEAVDGCWGVLHVASPFPTSQPKDEQVVIRPAVDGTLRVLRAAKAGGVERFVQTSSVAAVSYGYPNHRTEPFTEADWTIVDGPGVTPYVKSKTLAERAAREWVQAEGGAMHFSSVNPGFVLGPALDTDVGASAEIIEMFLKGKYPGTPRVSFGCIDVRDVATMHLRALERDLPNGGRYIGSADCLWMIDIAQAIRTGLGGAGKKAPSRDLPNWMVKLVGLFDPTAKQIVPELGRELRIDNSATRAALQMDFIPARDAAVAMAKSLIDLGIA